MPKSVPLPQSENRIIVFVKAPIAGLVKTRLGRTVGPHLARDIYETLARHVVSTASKVHDSSVHVYYTGSCCAEPFTDWLGSDKFYAPQEGRDLGERLSDAVVGEFQRGAKRVVVLGSDSPDIDVEAIGVAFTELLTHDCVLGPCLDGGYYLIGVRQPATALFSDIPWSTDQVSRVTLAKAESEGMSVALLQPLIDIDTENDLDSWLDRPGNEAIKQEITKKKDG